jgi:carbamoyl-phosphate synthase large subunit
MAQLEMPTALGNKPRIYLGGAGGAPTNNVIWSLRESGDEVLIGASSSPTDLYLADVDARYWVPAAGAPGYEEKLIALVEHARPDFMHFQHDFEIRAVSRFRDRLLEKNIRLYMPDTQVIETCIDKAASYSIWRAAGIRVPDTFVIRSETDLKKAFDALHGKVWLRATEGGGGKGAVPTDSYEFAKLWIERFDGWGSFTAAQVLTSQTVTWLSIWFEGELIVAQTRRRRAWGFGDRTLSGVTGITAVAETWSDDAVTRIAIDSISAIDPRPHGIYGVDMTYDHAGVANPTEINISRFFTTVYFFTAAGLNMPRMFVDIGLYGKFPSLDKKINPLPDGLLWIRGMDQPPKLVRAEELNTFLNQQRYCPVS